MVEQSKDKLCTLHGLSVRLDALEKMLDEREERTKERFGGMKTAVDAALAAADRAVSKAEQATERRFESVNEFRETLADQSTTFLPRIEYTVQHQGLIDKTDGLSKRIEIIQASISRIEERGSGRKEGFSTIGVIVMGVVAGVSALVSAATLAFNLLHR